MVFPAVAVDVIGSSVAVAVVISALQFLRCELGLPLIYRMPRPMHK